MKGKYIAIFAVFVFIISFFSTEARAVNWKLYATATDRDNHYYDPQSIKQVSKDIVRVWEKGPGPHYPYQSQSSGLVSLRHLEQRYRYSISLIEYNCSEKKFCFLSLTHYNQDGDVIESVPINSDFPSWNFIVPDSIEEHLFNIVCGGR